MNTHFGNPRPTNNRSTTQRRTINRTSANRTNLPRPASTQTSLSSPTIKRRRRSASSWIWSVSDLSELYRKTETWIDGMTDRGAVNVYAGGMALLCGIRIWRHRGLDGWTLLVVAGIGLLWVGGRCFIDRYRRLHIALETINAEKEK